MAITDHNMPGWTKRTAEVLDGWNTTGVPTATGASSGQVQGTAASNAAAVGNPVLTGTKYNATPQTFDDGDVANLQSDVNGYTKIVEQYIPKYEDNTLNKAVVEHRYTPSYNVAADAQIKAGAGFIHTVTFSCNDAAPTAGSIILYDSLTETGSVLFNHTFTTTPFAPFTVLLDMSFATGLYAGFTTTADVNISISYR